MSEPIPKRQLDLSQRRLKARFYAVILEAILECEVDEEFIALRIGKDVSTVQHWLDTPKDWTIDIISDLILSVACDFDDFRTHPIRRRNLKAEQAKWEEQMRLAEQR